MFTWVTLALVTTVGVSCSRADSSLPLSTSETVEVPPLPLTETSELGPDEGDSLGAFPTFMPPVAIGTETQECQLGTDPYSTCI